MDIQQDNVDVHNARMSATTGRKEKEHGIFFIKKIDLDDVTWTQKIE